MDYSVGSLADLISGSNTPNKPKVIKQEFKKNNKTAETSIKKVTKKVIKKVSVKINQEEPKSIKHKKKLTEKVKLSPTTKKEGIPKKRKIIESDPSDENSVPPKKKKLNQNEENAERRVKKKVKEERKIHNPEDSDPSDENSVPPKKKKLNQNEENAERRVKKKVKEERKIHNPEDSARTIFVGNIPITCNKKKIKRHFKKYGEIESIRIRGISVADPKTSKKVAAIKKEFNPNRTNVICYIRFVEKESAQKAEAENGALFEEHHLRVHCCTSTDKPDETRAIFIGNLSFNAVEDDLWKLFESCGPISYVRIIRDSHTGMGKGFAYVNFKDSDAVQLALEMENVKLNDRELRIALCNLNSAKRNKKFNKNKKITQSGKQKFRKRFNKPSDEADGPQNGVKTEFQQVKTEFQGSKFSDKKKKFKVNKGLLEKKKLVKSIAPKPK